MSNVWDLMKKHYGERWAYFMPPQGKPVTYIENSSVVNPFLPAIEAPFSVFKTTPVKAQTGEVLVITRYGLQASAAVVNPYWPGRLPTPLPETAFQGRFAWTVMNIDVRADERSLIGDVTYQNTDVFPAGHIQAGRSLLKYYTTGMGDPPFIISPNSTVYLAAYALPANRGAEPPPADSPQIVLTAELSGFRLPIPVDPAWGRSSIPSAGADSSLRGRGSV